MNNRKLFFADLDGTLLTTDKKVSDETYKALSDFVDRGNSFIICTGRGLESALTVRRELNLGFPNSYIVAFNGCQIYDCNTGDSIVKAGVPLQMVRELFKLAEEYGVYVHTFSDDYVISGKDDEEIRFYRRAVKTPVVITDDPAGYLDYDPCKMICIELHDHEKQERFRHAVEERYGDIIDTMYSNAYYLEIIPKGYSKGRAVEILASHLGVPIEDTIAAGDQENDISMLISAGTGIAMANASEGTKAAADVVTKLDNDHDGLAEYLRGF